jgi:putative salt-induced outer membrane protein YdiY
MLKAKRVLALLAVLPFTSQITADVVILKNGDRITGTVDSISVGRVLVKTEYAGNVPIALGAVAELVTDEAFNISTDGGRLEGRFVTQNGQTMIATADGVRGVDVTTISRAGQNNLALTALGADWSSRADLSAIISNGNSDTQSLNTLIESVYKKDKVQHSVSLLVAEEEAEGVTTKDQLDLDYLYKRFVSEKWYASGNAEYFKDKLKEIDARVTLGAGMGYQFWDNSFGSFSSDLGISAVYEDTNGADEIDPALRWGLDYRRWLLQKKLEFFHKQSVLFIPDSDRGEVIASSTGLRYALNDRIDAAARVDLTHETEPAPGASKSDVTYTIGVGIKF